MWRDWFPFDEYWKDIFPFVKEETAEFDCFSFSFSAGFCGSSENPFTLSFLANIDCSIVTTVWLSMMPWGGGLIDPHHIRHLH